MKSLLLIALATASLTQAKTENRTVANFSSSGLVAILEEHNFVCDQKKVDNEADTRGRSAYECIGTLSNYKNKVHIFLPSKILKSDQVNTINFFFHGFWSPETFFKNKNNLDGAGDFAALLEKSNSQKSILVILESAGQCADYEPFIQDAKKFISVKNEIENLMQFKFLQIKLSGHSGAYRVVNGLMINPEISRLVQQIGLFDSIYDAKTNLLNIRNWLGQSTENKLKISYVVGAQQSTKAQTEKFLSLASQFKNQIEVQILPSDQPNAHLSAMKNGGFSDFLKD